MIMILRITKNTITKNITRNTKPDHMAMTKITTMSIATAIIRITPSITKLRKPPNLLHRRKRLLLRLPLLQNKRAAVLETPCTDCRAGRFFMAAREHKQRSRRAMPQH
ncbi:hypothetical protein V8J88_16570 [Massilia sp. W12]|uniref:hypothetical protein n=1 Tax=Massilia sp. W12 TaxID=3126507 RepID=UPI0030CD552A